MARKLIPTNTKREDCVQTPIDLANKLVEHFKPKGRILEPCRGDGNFYKAIQSYTKSGQLKGHIQNKHTLEWCEVLKGRDFFDFNKKVDWIITNPPYSKMRKFIQKSMEVSDNIVFLTTINHLWLKARLRDIFEKKFGIKEIIIFDTPKTFPQSGFQIGCFYLKKGYVGNIKFNKGGYFSSQS
jgi:hypothetical protein|tara:strand:+ start:951 stop:1499 length:549 start_codon:yes stop_codon:yes gene_type:complete